MMWIWLSVAFLLIVMELLTQSFAFLFFALGAFVVSILVHFIELSEAKQVTFFAIVSGLSLLLGRKKLLKKFKHAGPSEASADIGQVVRVLSDIEPGQEGQAEYQGSPWTVVNRSSKTLISGSSAKIIRIEGVKLDIE